MAKSRYVFNAAEYEAAVRANETFKVISDCPNSEFNGETIQHCLDIGVSNPYAPDYSLVGEIDTGEPEVNITSLENLDEGASTVDIEGFDANGSPTAELPTNFEQNPKTDA